MSAISSISSNYIQSLLSNTNPLKSGATASQLQQADQSQLSPFAQIVSKLQDLQQSDPAKYKQVTEQISANLTAAAQTAQSNGNTTAATQLNQLASDFSDASKSGNLPNFKDLAQAVAGGHHGHHHAHAAKPKTDSDGDNDQSSSQLSQLLNGIQPGGTQTGSSFDPAAIIFSTLQSAGLTSSGN